MFLYFISFDFLLDHLKPEKKMRKRDIQSFTLKLNDIKEYENMKAQTAKNTEKATGSNETTQKSHGFLFSVGPKTKQEIRERIGLPTE